LLDTNNLCFVRRVSIRAAEERLACRGHRERLAPASEKTRLTIEDPSTRGVRSYCAAKNPGTVTAEVASSSLVVPRPGNKGRKTREDLHPGRIHRLPAVFTPLLPLPWERVSIWLCHWTGRTTL